jgi:prepilin-type N-terminal cleavage/methylation domain-containing protein
MKIKNEQAFTLIELLVVIAIIGVLASIIYVSLSAASREAKIGRAEGELAQIKSVIRTTSFTQDKALKDITGSGCSDCACRTVTDLSILPDTHQCIINWNNVIDKLNLPTGFRDPWGSPYLLDENELEYVADPCRMDGLRSAGLDKKLGTADDIRVVVPFYTPQCNP